MSEFRTRAVLFLLAGVSLLVPSAPTSGGVVTERVAPIVDQDGSRHAPALMAARRGQLTEPGGGPKEDHGQVAETPSGMTVETLRAGIGTGIDVDDAVLRALIDYPGFVDTPAVLATSGQSEGRENDDTQEKAVQIRHIGGGWFETISHYRVQGGSWRFYESTSRNIEFLAGLIVVATREKTTSERGDRPRETRSMGTQIVAIEAISGRLFPIAIGNTLSLRMVWQRQFELFGPQTLEYTIEYEWHVTRTIMGRSVGLPTDEEVFEVIESGADVSQPNEDPILSTRKFYFVPSLGIAVNSGQYDDRRPDLSLQWISLE